MEVDVRAVRACVLVGILVVSACTGPDQTEVEGTLAIVNGTLIDGTGAEPVLDAVVVIEGDRIVAAGPSSAWTFPDNLEVIDAQGGTILPGLVDTHTHHLSRIRYDEVGAIEDRSISLYVELPLQAGVTTFRDAGSPYGFGADLAALRKDLAAWDGMLPNVVVGGPLLAMEGAVALERFAGQGASVANADEAAALTVSLLENGIDQIKIMIETDLFGSSSPSLGPGEVAAITDAAHERGARVFAHVSDADEARLALANGVDELTHWPGSDRIPDDVVTALAEQGVPVGTTFSIIQPYEGDVRRLLDAGVRIVVSTDAPGATAVTGIAGELYRMVEAGMTPMEAIVAATRDGAEAVGLGGDVGTIEVGRIADLVIIEGDPLENIATVSAVLVTVRAGVVAFEA